MALVPLSSPEARCFFQYKSYCEKHHYTDVDTIKYHQVVTPAALSQRKKPHRIDLPLRRRFRTHDLVAAAHAQGLG